MDILNRIWAVFTNFTDPAYAIAGVSFICALTVAFYILFRFVRNNGSNKIVWLFTAAMILGGIVFTLLPTLDNHSYIIVPVVFILGILMLYSSEIKRNIKYRTTKVDLKNLRKSYDEEEVKSCINAIISALQNMSKKDIGAIIVLSNNNIPSQILDSGVKLNADISSELLESVFFPKSPLHDGAVIISGTKITAAGCFLPLSQNENIPKDLGTRHRAGIGITENFDVTALIVSEETGIISLVSTGGKITRYANTEKLMQTLSRFYWQELTKDLKDK
ncbi:MAG: diadenylate cyclase [Clostridia bacterium]|nr:diadenylate cyclase [Clostridia bacterium]